MMRLPKAGCEYAHWGISGYPNTATFEVLFLYEDNTDSGWLSCEQAGSTLKKLVRGPTSVSVANSVLLPLGEISTFVRLTDTPEVVIRAGGFIEVF